MADQGLLEAATARGWMTRAPRCFEIGDGRDAASSSSFARGAGPGWIALQSNARGEVYWPCVESGDPTNERAILVRAHTLLHEAGHIVLHQMSEPFQPTPGRMGQATIEALNRWRMGPMSTGLVGRVRSVFHECFADTWAAAALLELTGHAPETVRLVEDLQQIRAAHSEQAETTFARRQVGDSLTTFGGVHHTQHALAHLLATRDRWQGETAAVLTAWAQQIASDATLDWVRPARLSPDGQPQGRGALEHWIGPDTFDITLGAFFRYASLAQGEAGTAAWQRADHPAIAVIEQLWTQIQRELDGGPASEAAIMRDSLEGPAKSGADGRLAINRVRQAAERSLRQSSGAPAVKACQEHYEQDQKTIRHGLEEVFLSDRPRIQRANGFTR